VLEDSRSSFGNTRYRNGPVSTVEVAIRFSRPRQGEFDLQFTRLRIDGQEPGLPFEDPSIRDILQVFVPGAFTHLGVARTLSVNALDDGGAQRSRVVGTIPDGEVVRELFQAKNARDRALRERFDQVRSFMASALHRGLCDVFLDPDTQRLELREALPEPNPHGLDIRIDRAGHGVVQLYAIIAPILLAGGRLVAIEEPEAHLHAPSTGRELRALLKGMVREGRVDQLFITTHSNVFDLDPTGYWDVSLDSETAGTRVFRRDLVDSLVVV
jgi:hypothetical protein